MRSILILCIGLVLALPSQAQERVTNVRIRVADSSRLEIWYDMLNARPGDSVYFVVRSRLRGALQILPEFVRGDVGKRLTAGSDRRIVWDALANGYSLNEEIRATVLVKAGPPIIVAPPTSTEPTIAAKPGETPQAPRKSEPLKPAPTESVVTTPPSKVSGNDQPATTPRPEPPATQPSQAPSPTETTEPQLVRRRYVGPAWALVSAVAPGIGNIFVQTPRPRVGFRPLVTVATYGLVVYGFMERQKAQDNYAIYQEQKNATAAEPYYQTANSFHHRYWLATRGAIVLAAADVILTFFKGIRNNQIKKNLQQNNGLTLRPGIQVGQPTAVLRYSF